MICVRLNVGRGSRGGCGGGTIRGVVLEFLTWDISTSPTWFILRILLFYVLSFVLVKCSPERRLVSNPSTEISANDRTLERQDWVWLEQIWGCWLAVENADCTNVLGYNLQSLSEACQLKYIAPVIGSWSPTQSLTNNNYSLHVIVNLVYVPPILLLF